jgi:hypothetical protein
VTFIVVEQTARSSESVFSVLRVCDHRQDVISRHRTKDGAINAAQEYAVQARFSGLDAAVFQGSYFAYGTEAAEVALPT